MMFWAFGQFIIGALFLVCAWVVQIYKHRAPFQIYNAPLWFAVGLAGFITSFTILLGVRLTDIVGGVQLPTLTPVVYRLGWVGAIISETILVWVAALREGRNYSRGLWMGYIACSFTWALFCIGVK